MSDRGNSFHRYLRDMMIPKKQVYIPAYLTEIVHPKKAADKIAFVNH